MSARIPTRLLRMAPGPSARAKLLHVLAGVLIAACLQGCGKLPGSSGRYEVDLLEEAFLSVATETRGLELPPSIRPNRLVAGWRPRPGGGLEPAASSALIELVNLRSRPRTLHFQPILGATHSGVSVFLGEKALGSAPPGTDLAIPLTSLPAPGNYFLRLEFPPGPRPAVRAAALASAMPPGEVERQGENLVQSPSSLATLLHRSVTGGILRFSFEAPTSFGPEQRFEAWLEDADNPEKRRIAVFSAAQDEDPNVEVEVPPGAFELTFVALGDGPSGRWIAPRLGLPSSLDEAAEPPPETPSQNLPKVVVVYVLDALRADAVDGSAKAAETPAFARLGQEGRTFRQHRSVAPNTLPSTASLFYGRLFSQVLSPRDVDVQDATPLAETFREQGYTTALFSSNTYVTGTFHMDRGFDYVEPPIKVASKGANLASENVVHAAKQWIDGQDPSERLFLYLHIVNPHNPYTPPTDFDSRNPERDSDFISDTPNLVDIREGRLTPDAPQTQAIRRAYRDSVAYADAALEDFFGWLEARYDKDELALAVTSDHGEELLEEGRGILHGFTLFDEALRIPLVLWPAERFGRGPIEIPTTTLDLHRILDRLAHGLDPMTQPPSQQEGVVAFAASGIARGVFGVANERWKIIFTGARLKDWGMGHGPSRTWDTEYLLDLREGERRNRLAEADLEARWLRALAIRLSANQNAIAGSGEPVPELDEETKAQLKALGYL